MADEHVTARPPAGAGKPPSGITTEKKKAKRPTLSAEAFAARLFRFDVVLVGLVLAFAFLVAAFPALNSDLFLNMAAGRDLLNGTYQFGVDPYSFTTTGTYWANHSWLFGVGSYLIYAADPDGPALVLLKAVLIVLLAGLMLTMGRRPGQTLWVPAVMTALGILAASPRFFLQPTVLSFVLLGLTLYLLRRPAMSRAANPTAPVSFTAYWLLPVVCLLWVNLDNWFLLGPLTVALVLVGRVLQEMTTPGATDTDSFAPGEKQTLTWVLIASVLACLVNPHHVNAFTLPPQLGLIGSNADLLGDDPEFRYWFLSPLSSRYFHPALGLSPAGVAYFPLLVLGALSFGMASSRLRWWRVTVWLFFALLSAYHARAIPFFAVVAAPITSLNFLDWAASRKAPDRRWSVSGRLLCLLLGVVLVGAAIPGWLQATPHGSRMFGLDVRPDASGAQVAQQIAAWRGAGLLTGEGKWLNTSSAAAHYLAWYAPGEKSFLDTRINLFRNVASDFAAVRRTLQPPKPPPPTPPAQPGKDAPPPPPPPQEEKPAWPKVCKEWGVHFLLVHEATPGNLNSPVRRVFQRPAEWALLYTDGHATIAGWIDPNASKIGDAYAGMRLDVNRRAFGPDAPRVPASPIPPPQPPPWYKVVFTWPEPPRPIEFDEAVQMTVYFQAEGAHMTAEEDRALVGFTLADLGGMMGASWVGGGPGPIVHNPVTGVVFYKYAFPNGRQRTGDGGPPAALYLALRAARRAVAANPDDARNYMLLGQIYYNLLHQTRERSELRKDFSYLAALRQFQIQACLQRAVQIDPEQGEAHFLLFQTYAPRFGDLAVHHFREYVKHMEAYGKASAENMAGMRKQLEEAEAQLKRTQDTFVNESAKEVLRNPTASGLIRVQVALRLGLGDEAIKLLTGKEIADQASPANLQLLSDTLRTSAAVFFDTGRLDLLTSIVNPDNKQVLGDHPSMPVPAYEWYEAAIQAVLGDYPKADEYLRDIQDRPARHPLLRTLRGVTRLSPAPTDKVKESLRPVDFVGLALGHYLLRESQGSAVLWGKEDDTFYRVVRMVNELVGQEADMLSMRGMLALEAGDNTVARQRFEDAIDLIFPRQRHLPMLLPLAGSCPLESAIAFAAGSHASRAVPIDFRSRPIAFTALGWLRDAAK